MVFTRLAVLLATSLADWTNWRLATGLAVREEARRHVLHRAEVCFATMVAADSTCGEEHGEAVSIMTPHPHSSPFLPVPHGAPVRTEPLLGSKQDRQGPAHPYSPPSGHCHHCSKGASWFLVQLMGLDETQAIILANSWDTALPNNFTLPFVQENACNGAPAHTHLGLGAGRVHQVLAGHLDSLVSSGKLSGVYQALLSSLAVGVRDPHEVGSLGAQERR